MDRRDFIKKTAVAAATTAMATPAMAMLTKVDSATHSAVCRRLRSSCRSTGC